MNTKFLPFALISGLAVLPLCANASSMLTLPTIADTFVRSDSSNDSFGTSGTLLVGGHGGVGPFNSFYRFDLTSPDLVGATINSAVLRLTSINDAGAGSVNINLYQLSAANADWKEGVSGTVPTGTSDTGATFNNKAGQGASAIQWAGGNTNANFVAGVDYVSTVLGNYTGPTNTGAGGQNFDLGNVDLVSLIQGSLGLELNLLVMDQTGGTNFLRIASREHLSFSAPQLMITYTPIPEPSVYAALFGLLALGLIIRRRHKRTAA